MKRSKARVPFTSWCCNIVIRNGSRVIIMGVAYVFNIFIKSCLSGTTFFLALSPHSLRRTGRMKIENEQGEVVTLRYFEHKQN